jgi:bacteriocin biosynthesis cyclodehydratase domain
MKKVDIFTLGHMSYQVRTKSAVMVVEFDNKDKEGIFKDIILLSDEQQVVEANQIIKELINLNKYDVSDIDSVVSQLSEYNFFDLFVDDKNISSISKENVISKDILVVGDGKLSDKMKQLLVDYSFKNVFNLSYSELLEKIETISNMDFMLVDGSCFNPVALKLINKTALANNKPWLYIGGFENEWMKIGPLFYGAESGCYECLEKRKLSNSENPIYDEDYICYLSKLGISSKPDSIPLEDFQLNILANWAVIEMLRFFQEKKLIPTWKNVISLDTYKYKIYKSELLRNPYCPICRPAQKHTFSPWLDPQILDSEKI